jgi:hypothetical protein
MKKIEIDRNTYAHNILQVDEAIRHWHKRVWSERTELKKEVKYHHE